MNLTIILMENDNEMSKICDVMQSHPEGTEFCGCWGEIKFNDAQCIESISGAVNHFLEPEDKDTVIFACHCNDIDRIEPHLQMQNCNVRKISAESFFKSMP